MFSWNFSVKENGIIEVMKINSKQVLKEFLDADCKNYQCDIGIRKYWNQRIASPISDQWYIWKYIKIMRMVEFHTNLGKTENGISMIFHKLAMYLYRYRLRHISRITDFQIGLNTCGKGLSIWHWGPIIINSAAQLGENCTLYPGVLIGHKSSGLGAPKIGDNCFIASGCKIIGNITIGDNVIIAPNTVVFKNIPSNCVVAGNPAVIIKQNGKKVYKEL